MKRKFLFAICIYCVALLISSQLHAQKTEYQSIFGETNTSFNVLYSYHQKAARVCEETLFFHFDKDTIVNEVEYKRFWVYVGYLFDGPYKSYFFRESEDHSKLYTLLIWDESHEGEIITYTEEVLLMDLDLNLHDTFNYAFRDENYNLIVENIFYDEKNLKHILFSTIKHSIEYGDNAYYQFEFIEGIGSTAVFGIESRLGLLLCAYQDDTNVFTNYSDFLPAHIRGKCFYEHWHVGIENVPVGKNNLKIYPNPAHHFVEIDLGEDFMNYQSLFVYDLLGRPCLNTSITQEKQRIDIQSLPSGIYIIKAIGKDKPPVYGKFSVIR